MEPIEPQQRQTRWRKILDTWAGVVLPALCFSITWTFAPDWQTGNLADYALLFLSGAVTVVFLPLLLVAVTGLLLATWWPASRGWWGVRLAVASGLPLSIQYHAGVFFTLCGGRDRWLEAAFIALLACPLILFLSRLTWLCGQSLIECYGARWVWIALGLLHLIASALVLLLDSYDSVFLRIARPSLVVLGFTTIVSFVAAPSWSLWVYLRLYREIAGTAPQWTRLGALSAGGVWLIAWYATWQEGVRQLLLRYAELPASPPECFLATAAGRGHPWLVGSRPARTAGGRTFPVTWQLRRLKAAELVLANAAPACHRRLRRVYDDIGQRLARRLTHPLAADLVWLALKPAELAATLVLGLTRRETRQTMARIWPSS